MAITAAKLQVVVEAVTGQAVQGLQGVESMLGRLKGAAGQFGAVFAGTLGANLFTNAISGFKNLAAQGLQAYANYERMGQSIQSLTAREMLNAGAARTMGEAYAAAGPKAAELMKWIQQLAINSPFNPDDVAQAFKMAQAYGFTADEAQRLTTALIDFASGAGLGGDSMRQVSLALGQIQAKGKLAGQEVLQLVNAGIAVDQILADAFGKSTAEIVEMREKGLIPAEQAIEAIVSSLEQDFGGAAERAATSFTGLVTSMEEIKNTGLREFFAGTAEALKPIMQNLVDAFSTGVLQEQIRAVGEEFGQFVGSAVTGAQDLIGWWGTLDQATKKLIISIGGAGLALIALQGPLTVIIGLVGLLGGPVTILVAAVAALGVGIAYLAIKMKDFKTSVDNGFKPAIADVQTQIDLTQGKVDNLTYGMEKQATGTMPVLSGKYLDLAVRTDYLSHSQKELYQNMQLNAVAGSQAANAAKEVAAANEAAVISVQNMISEQAVQAGLSGELGDVIEAYTQDIAKLQEEYKKLADQPIVYTKKFGGSEEGKSVQGSNIQALTDAMKENADAQEEAAEKMREATTAMIFQQAAAGLDAAATLQLARTMGVMSEADYAVAKTVQDMKGAFAGADNVFDAGEAYKYAQAIENVNAAVQNLILTGQDITLESIQAELDAMAGDLTLPTPTWAGDIGDEIGPAVNQAKTEYVRRFKEMNMGVVEEAKKGAADVASAFTDKDWNAVGTSIDEGILAGINSKSKAVADAAAKAATDAWEAAMAAIGAESPSKKFALVGKYAMQGFARGIEEFAPAVKYESTAAAMSALGAASVTNTSNSQAISVTVNANVANDLDTYRLAQIIADEIRVNRM